MEFWSGLLSFWALVNRQFLSQRRRSFHDVGRKRQGQCSNLRLGSSLCQSSSHLLEIEEQRMMRQHRLSMLKFPSVCGFKEKTATLIVNLGALQ
jgi:hypothetical protein